MNDFVCIQDVEALRVYLRMVQAPESYNAENDFFNLQHWVNLVHNRFAQRLKEAYPYLTPTELTICCLQRMGYSYHEMSIVMHVKEETVRRNIYRICSHFKLDNAKLKFPGFIADY